MGATGEDTEKGRCEEELELFHGECE